MEHGPFRLLRGGVRVCVCGATRELCYPDILDTVNKLRLVRASTRNSRALPVEDESILAGALGRNGTFPINYAPGRNRF